MIMMKTKIVKFMWLQMLESGKFQWKNYYLIYMSEKILE